MEVLQATTVHEERVRLNDHRRINKFLEAVNRRLPVGGLLHGHLVVASARKERILSGLPKGVGQVVYACDYAVHRVWPKLPGINKLYFAITKGRGRVVSEMEAIGRLHCCGFKVVSTKQVGEHLHFVAEKVGAPAYDVSATYGPLIRLRRVGYQGRTIRVYKIRTMVPYSEYVQDYVYRRNGYGGGSGFRNDARITVVGRFMRKYWLDELPMLWNLLNGTVKLVGVRPVSRQYFDLAPEGFKAFRVKFKPGLIPPMYAHPELAKTEADLWRIEEEYLRAYEKAPLTTDLRYLFKVVHAILFKRVRSA